MHKKPTNASDKCWSSDFATLVLTFIYWKTIEQFLSMEICLLYFELISNVTYFTSWTNFLSIFKSDTTCTLYICRIKVIYPKYSKHLLSNVAHTIDCVCNKMLNHGLNHEFFLSLFKLIICPHTLNCICVSLFKFHIWILKQF